MTSPSKIRPFQRGSNTNSFGILLLLFLCASFVVFFKPTKTNDDIQNTYNVFNNNNLLSTNNDIYNIQYDTIKTPNINIKKTTPTPIHNPTHMDLHSSIGPIIHSGGYAVIPRERIAQIVRDVIHSGNCSPENILSYLGIELAGFISPEQLEDIFNECHRLMEMKLNAGATSDQAIDYLQRHHDTELRLRKIVKNIHQDILTEYFNTTIIVNNNLIIPKTPIGDFHNGRVAVYAATSSPDNKKRRKSRIDSDNNNEVPTPQLQRMNMEDEEEEEESYGSGSSDEDNESIEDEEHDDEDKVWDDRIDQMAITEEGEATGVEDTVNDVEASIAEFEIDLKIDETEGKEEEDEEQYSGKVSDEEREVVDIFQALGFNNRDFIRAGIAILDKPEGNESLFRKKLRAKLKGAVKRYQLAHASPEDMNIDIVETEVNNDRIELYDGMGNEMQPEDRHRRNLSHPHSRHIRGVVYLHYSPDGTPQVNRHCMPYNQCCVRAMTNSLTRATHHALTGEKSTKEYGNLIQSIDLACTTAVKFEGLTDLHEQYDTDAKMIGLNDRYEYYWVNAVVYINSISLGKVVNHNTNKVLMTLVASAATASEAFGENNKERMAITGGKLLFTIHPQGLMMGQGKSKHYVELQETMSLNLITFYTNILEGDINSISDENKNLLAWFGKDWIDNDIDVGLLSLLAKHLAGDGELTLDQVERINETSIDNVDDKTIKDIYYSQLEIHNNDKAKLVNLIRRFRAGQYLQTLASQIDDFDDLTPEMEANIERVGTLLNKKKRQIINRLKRIKKAQEEGGERLALLNKLAARYLKEGKESIMDDISELKKYVRDGRTPDQIMEMVEDTAKAQEEGGERLASLNKLAARYLKEGKESIMDDISELEQHVRDGRTPDQIMEMVANTALMSSSIRSKLVAKLLTEGRDEVISEVKGLVELLKTGRKEEYVLQMIEREAQRKQAYFWEMYKKLKKYINDNKDNKQDPIFFEVNGNDLFAMGSSDNDKLYCWWQAQVLSDASKSDGYSIRAVELGSSSEYYQALEQIKGISFVSKDVRDAIEKRHLHRKNEEMSKTSHGKVAANLADENLDFLSGPRPPMPPM